MFKRLLIALLLVLFTSLTAFADVGVDDQGNPNDPNVNERANACYTGGSLAGRCDSELLWSAGWYLIRWEYGIFTRDQVHALVRWVLPPEPEPEDVPSAPAGVCAFAVNPNFYVDFTKSNFVGSGNYWSDPACTVPNGNLARKWVFSPSGQGNATSICVANMGAGYIAIPSDGPLVFECVL